MARLTIMRGLPGSGKSTAARKSGAVRVNRDDIREMLGGEWSPELEKKAIAIRDEMIVRALEAEMDVVSDDTNLAQKHISHLTELGKKWGAEVVVDDSFLKVPLETCLERDAKREGKARVGEKVINDMYTKYRNLFPKEQSVEIVKPEHRIHSRSCHVYSNYQPPYEECTCEVGKKVPTKR